MTDDKFGILSDKSKIPITYNCSVCVESYDVNKKKPFILSPCGHILCSSCMACINKLCENICPTCKLNYEKTLNSLPSYLESIPENPAKSKLDKIKELKADFVSCYTNELAQKNKYFQALRHQVKEKTERDATKLYENEKKILAKINELEINFDEILRSLSGFDKNLNNEINNWDSQIEQKSVDCNESNIISAVQTETANLEYLIEKLKTASFSETCLNISKSNEINIDEEFLKSLLKKINAYSQVSSNSKIESNPDTFNKSQSKSAFSSPKTAPSISNDQEKNQNPFDTDVSTCFKCKYELTGTYNVYKNNRYHTNCFTCCQCGRVIIESTFYNRDEEPLCRVCFNSNLVESASKCFKCSQVILDTLVTYKSNEYHDYCLTCHNCDQTLIGQSIYSDQEKNPFCIECYTIKEAKFCAACQKPIVPNQTSFLFNSQNFHKECFVCCRCTRQINSEETFFKSREETNKFVCCTCFKK